jgi:hypothetical protein
LKMKSSGNDCSLAISLTVITHGKSALGMMLAAPLKRIMVESTYIVLNQELSQ